MDRGDGAHGGIARLAELVGTARVGPDADPAIVLELVAESLGADAVIAGRMDDGLHVDHLFDRSRLGLVTGTILSLHDQHLGTRIETPGSDHAHAHYESIVLAGMGGPSWCVSVPLFTRDARAYGRLCALFSGARTVADDALALLRLAGLAIQVTLQDRTAPDGKPVDWQYQALHDPLTGLPNRLLLRDRLQHALAVGHRDAQPLAVMLLDLDGFKAVNDTLGHEAGDALLCEVAARLRRPLRESDTVARLGGDEFVVVLPGVDGAGAVQVARKLLRALRRPMALLGQNERIWASVGIAVYPDHGTTPADLLGHADAAMYRAKQREGGYALAVTGLPSWPESLRKPRELRS